MCINVRVKNYWKKKRIIGKPLYNRFLSLSSQEKNRRQSKRTESPVCLTDIKPNLSARLSSIQRKPLKPLGRGKKTVPFLGAR